MTLEGGNAVRGTGLAGAIARARRKGYPESYVPSKDKAVDPESAAIVDYLIDEGVMSRVERSGNTNNNSIARWDGNNSNGLQGSTVSISDTGAMSGLLNASFGSVPTVASFAANTITVNWNTGRPIQTVTITANATAIEMIEPSGIRGLCLIVYASGGGWTLPGIAGVTWYGAYNPGTETFTIPSGSSAILTLNYIGSSYYAGSLSLAKD